MASSGPILILEDDLDDIEILEQCFKDLGTANQRMYFHNGFDFLKFLRETKEHPLIIFSDIRVGVLNGLEIRDEIQKDEFLRKKGIPFVFLSTDARKTIIQQAYELTVQGFFEKEYSVQGVQQQIKHILEYWQTCRHPNS